MMHVSAGVDEKTKFPGGAAGKAVPLYLCNRRRCKNCWDCCRHTTDSEFAVPGTEPVEMIHCQGGDPVVGIVATPEKSGLDSAVRIAKASTTTRGAGNTRARVLSGCSRFRAGFLMRIPQFRKHDDMD